MVGLTVLSNSGLMSDDSIAYIFYTHHIWGSITMLFTMWQRGQDNHNDALMAGGWHKVSDSSHKLRAMLQL